MGTWCKKLADSDVFESFILSLIIVNAVLMGLETSETLELRYGDAFYFAFIASQILFVAEITIRIVACAPKFRDFFKSFWNSFDFLVVAASLIPVVGGFAIVARVVRVLRVLRIFSVSDEMRLFVEGIGRTVGLLSKAAILIAVFGYMFAISGFYLFSEVAPASWGTLGDSFRSVFFLALLQKIPELFAEIPPGDIVGKLYFPLFYLIHGAIGLNLVGAVVAHHHRSGERG